MRVSHTPPFQPFQPAPAATWLDESAADWRRPSDLEAEARDYESARVGPPSLEDERDRELTRRANDVARESVQLRGLLKFKARISQVDEPQHPGRFSVDVTFDDLNEDELGLIQNVVPSYPHQTPVHVADKSVSTPEPADGVDVPDEAPCVVCGLPDGDSDDDVVAHWWDGRQTQLAHTDCADDFGWRLA
jgi:hypothetical protein